MPTAPRNYRSESAIAQAEVALGSCPVGSWVDIYDLDDVLIYRGFVVDQRGTWGYTVIQPVTEGDGNFIGSAPTWSINKIRWEGQKKITEVVTDGTLARIYDMNERHRVQSERPVTWLGVDQELAAELEPEAISRESEGLPHHSPNGKPMSLVPTVSLIPLEEAE